MSSDAVVQLLTFALLLVFVYLLFIRPARRRAHEVAALQRALSPGDEVMLTSGIFGRVLSVEDDKVQIEVASDVVLTAHRGAVGKIVIDVPATSEPETDVPPDQEPDANDDQTRGAR